MIPVCDDEGPLRRCLDALARQSRPADEVVVVDNGSRDGSAAVARRHGARVVSCASPGIPAAAAAGYDAAEGDIVARLDADCRPGVDWLARIEQLLGDPGEVVAVTGGARFDLRPPWMGRLLAAVYLGSYRAVGGAALGHPPLFGSNLALRREAWARVSDRVHRDDPELHDDLDLAFHLGLVGRVRYDRGLDMTISARPFRDASAFAVRIRRGFRTVFAHWPGDFPPLRWVRRALAGRAGDQSFGAAA